MQFRGQVDLVAVEQPPNLATISGSLLTRGVTGMVCGLFAAPFPKMLMVALYVPTARPAGFTPTAIGFADPVSPTDGIDSQLELSDFVRSIVIWPDVASA